MDDNILIPDDTNANVGRDEELDIKNSMPYETKLFHLNRKIAAQALEISHLKEYITTGEVAKYILVNNKILDSLHNSKSADVVYQKLAVLEAKFEELNLKISDLNHTINDLNEELTNKEMKIQKLETEILSQQHNFTEVQQLTHHQKQHKVEINKYKKENANLRLSIERRDSEAAFISKDLKEKIGILAETNATVHKKAVLRPVADRVSSIIFY